MQNSFPFWQCNRALLVPLGPYKVKICVVPSRTPFLLSNNVFRKLDASIHTATDSVYFGKLGFGLPLTLSEKKLYLLDFAQLISRAHQTPVKQIETKEETILQSSDSRIGFGSSRTSCPRSGDSEREGRDADEPPLRLSCPSPDSEVRSQDPTDSGVCHGIHVEDSDLG